MKGTMRNYRAQLKTFVPFLWPSKSVCLQMRIIFCLSLVGVGRVINLYVPIYNKKIVESVTEFPGQFRWDLVVINVGLKFLQGGGSKGTGVLNNLRSFLWIRVQQYTTREIQVELFRHLHNLSLRWHFKRKTGEVLRVMDRGTYAINKLLSYLLFTIAPTIFDIIIAIIFFVTAFNKWFGLIVFSTMLLYSISTISANNWRTEYRRRMILEENEKQALGVDSLLNFETVKCYGAEEHEVERFKRAVDNFLHEEWNSFVALNILYTLQNVIIHCGLLVGSLLSLYMVVNDQGLSVGDFVLFTSYIVQLYVPLDRFGVYYGNILDNFVDMENMFDLLREIPEITDGLGASQLIVSRGNVEFSNVTFGYSPGKLILRNLSFVVPPEKTVALVGPSGAGKSTILRLLFRFYDTNGGAILIDGQHIKSVKQDTLRKALGVVPQDTTLFNETIRQNIKFGSTDAPDADVIAAAKGADIHERILKFPEGYETIVGERGLRLSGGEKQRVAIARTMLKAPRIVLLDEATSALDTQTERNIQAALGRVCANRTTLIIAHRLSTVIHADEILVLKEGEIVERGRHDELIARGGLYSEMWQDQLRNEGESKGEM